MTIYQEFLLDGARAYINNDFSGIYANMHIALNYVLTRDLNEEDFLSLLSKSKTWLDELEERGEIPDE